MRFNEQIRPFQKRYLPGWTKKVFVVRSVRKGKVPTYKVDEWDGTTFKGTFYLQDLQKVAVEDDDLFQIDRSVIRKGDKFLVHWKGRPDKYDTQTHSIPTGTQRRACHYRDASGGERRKASGVFFGSGLTLQK